ncbi:Dolichyl-diphosphooligosaccharide--protein glycosyltransferase subunit STT3B [Vitis vinifera]|uniref:dolichyl-diphosphooligosaccharide--protein glycotransferase n=1 Tax=Vitis vinifera TaxID=29760 RepID=A0A438HM37_VITVI|nr:Dolichyl-diphosphooligosaccharide--protein glycosyltransferase subunit STT3B [Vitis vinifera]
MEDSYLIQRKTPTLDFHHNGGQNGGRQRRQIWIEFNRINLPIRLLQARSLPQIPEAQDQAAGAPDPGLHPHSRYILAFITRLFSVLRYESMIHEFDPYFNYRTTVFFDREGILRVLELVRLRELVPSRRIIGGTLYPGLMVTAALIYSIIRFLRFAVHIREVCVLTARSSHQTPPLSAYFFGKELWDSGAGLVAAALIAICPGGQHGFACLGLASAFGYFYMVSAWGGYVFIINLIPLYAMVLLITGRFDLWAFSMCSLGSIWLQWVCFLDAVDNVLRSTIFAVGVGAIALGVGTASGYISPWTVMYGLTSMYFAGVMVRLILVATTCNVPYQCHCSFCHYKEFDSVGKDKEQVAHTGSTKGTTSGKASSKVSSSGKALPVPLDFCLFCGNDVFLMEASLDQSLPFQRNGAIALLIGAFYLLCKYATHCTWVTSEAYSSPSIVLAARGAYGNRVIFDDYREAYFWLRQNTPPDAKVMSWWDYGYQITAMGNRTVIVDNNTWNNTHIATVGRAMSSYEDEAYEIMRSLDVDYVLVVFGGVTGYSSDDINKQQQQFVKVGLKPSKLFLDLATNGSSYERHYSGYWDHHLLSSLAHGVTNNGPCLYMFSGNMLLSYTNDSYSFYARFLWMVRIGGGVFPVIKEPDYLVNGEYRVDKGAAPKMLNCLMYKLSYYRFGELQTEYGKPPGYDRARGVEIGNKDIKLEYLEEAFTTSNWIVRIYKVKPPNNRW